jgi:hypothetical protein
LGIRERNHWRTLTVEEDKSLNPILGYFLRVVWFLLKNIIKETAPPLLPFSKYRALRDVR